MTEDERLREALENLARYRVNDTGEHYTLKLWWPRTEEGREQARRVLLAATVAPTADVSAVPVDDRRLKEVL